MVLRIRQPALQEMMAAAQEIDWEDLKAFIPADKHFGGGIVDLVSDVSPAVAGDLGANVVREFSELEFQALEWATGVKDKGQLSSIADQIPEAVLEEQIRAYEGRTEPQTRPKRNVVYPHLLKCRNDIAQAFDAYARGRGWAGEGRLPYGSAAAFAATLVWSHSPSHKAGAGLRRKMLVRWHAAWARSQSKGGLDGRGRRNLAGATRTVSANLTLRGNGRQRRPFGKKHHCEWLRVELYEWWAHKRYSVDWDAIRLGIGHKADAPRRIARYTCSMIKAQAEHFLTMYCAEQLKHGVRPQVPRLRSDWFARWRREYGLCMRLPNRKYKTPRWLVANRLDVGWLNISRLRAACQEMLGYDPEIWNFDQSPFYHNESGSKNLPTLAVAGSKVPLVELHAETRARWTVNLLTRSDAEGLVRDGPPHVEFVFKADGKDLEARLKAHIRGRGWKNASAQTSPKGSYRTSDVMQYLDACLPKLPEPGGVGSEPRRWRILLADDHGPHHDEEVAKLAWNRGFIMLLHGGGVTPIVQTVDTDLNGPVKKKHVEKESRRLLQKMSAGEAVPRLRHEELMDLMMETLGDMSLHVAGARGFVKTGMRVGLGNDDSLDDQVVREAGDFWRER